MASKIAGVTGFARAGKDSVGDVLVELGWTKLAFADPLREMLAALDPVIAVDLGGRAARLSTFLSGATWERVKAHFPEVRTLLQRLGTEAGRGVLGPDVWVDAGMRRAAEVDGPVVFTDCRFQNEVAAIRAAGGRILHVERPGVEAVNDHPSERLAAEAFDTWSPEAAVCNDGTLEELAVNVRTLAAFL